MIVGFPGETDEDFREMLDLIEQMRFDRVGAFTYSVEDGTPAAEMPDQVPDSLKVERLNELMDVQNKISAECNAELVGNHYEALVDDIVQDPGPLGNAALGKPVGIARTVGQAINVDGVTYLYPDVGLVTGELVTIEIVEALDYDLIGRLVHDDR